MADLESVSYGVCLAIIVLFGAFALLLTRLRWRDNNDTTEFFLTARHSVPEFIVAGSFYTSAMGAWVVFAMASYVVSAGIVGLVFYSISCGFPILMIAYVGSLIQARYPRILSLGDFVLWRFGRPVQIYVAALMAFNMALALAAEYTAVGSLFSTIFGVSPVPIVVTIAVITSVYTAVGGLYVSIITDVGQAALSLVLLFIVYLYVAVAYRPGPLPPLDNELGPNYWGYSSIAAMPISLAAATVFSEGFWQRVWASADDRALKRGALWASIAVTLVCFLFGFGGFLALWAGYQPSQPDPNGTNSFFTLLTAGNVVAPDWVLVVVAAITVTMSEGTVDSFQNAITDTLSAVFLRTQPTWATRVIVFIFNIPLVIVSLQNYNINSIFLLGNVLCTISAIPILIGLWEPAQRYIRTGACLFGCLIGFWAVAIFGYFTTGDLGSGLQYTFLISYDWPTFVIAPVTSAIGVAIWVAAEALVRLAFGLSWPLPKSPPEELKIETFYGEKGHIVDDDTKTVDNFTDAKEKASAKPDAVEHTIV